ncbi:MAG: hypothetical protein PHF18_11860 [Methanosarcina sp.]|nr:hypothetical protein [Methanosarcina sp.]MDD3247527.1 hypothetical protein [Methanosarcina sp.]
MNLKDRHDPGTATLQQILLSLKIGFEKRVKFITLLYIWNMKYWLYA